MGGNQFLGHQKGSFHSKHAAKEKVMDLAILTAIIGGVFTVGASIVAVIVTRLFDNPMGFKKNVRQAALIGHWDGAVHQEGGQEYHIALQLKSRGRTIRGEGVVHGLYQGGNITEPLTVFGGFIHDRFLKIEYTMEAQLGSIQFGFSLLELSPDGRTLSGSFLGYGALTRGLIHGTLHIQKQGARISASVPLQKTI